MRIYNPQNQFGQDLVTKQLVNTKLLAITGYGLEGDAPSKTLQAQINDIVEGGLRYKVLPETSESGDSWTLLKGLIDKQKTATLTPEEKEKVKSYLKTVILVAHGGGEGGNIYTEYLVFEDTTDHYAYEKIGEIGGDVTELISRIETLERAKVSDIQSTGSFSTAITVSHTQSPTTESGTIWTIAANAATENGYGVVQLSALGAEGTSAELVVTEAQLKAVNDGLNNRIDELVDGTTVVLGQVLTENVDVSESDKSGTFSVEPRSGIEKVKILAVQDNTGEQWSYKLSTTDLTGATFQVWNGVTEYNAMVQADTAPDSFTVSYAVVELTQVSAS